MSNPVTPTDELLAKIANNDIYLINALRALFDQAGTLSPDLIDAALLAAGNAENSANQANASIEKLASAVELLALNPKHTHTEETKDLTPSIIIQDCCDDLTPLANLSDLGGEYAFTKNTAFNKNFGTLAGEIAPAEDVLSGSYWDGSTVDTTGDFTIRGGLVVGEPGTEGSGITVHGTTFNSTFKVSDLGGTNPAQTILHRHSTTLPPAVVGARSHSDTASHAIVVDGDNLLDIFALGHDGTDYEIAASIRMEVDGTPGNNDMPGRIVLSTTPSGGFVPVDAVTVDSDQLVKLTNDLELTEGGTGASTAADARTNLDVDQAGTDNSTNVTLAGTLDYLTLLGQQITLNAIDLTTDVSGDLPIADGGTGASDAATARTNLDVDQAGTDNSTNVTLDGTPNYITIVGQLITRALINLTSHVTGILPLANGGTGSSTLTAAEVSQIENINTTTISGTQWGYLGAFDQGLATTDDHTMNKAIVNDTTDSTSTGTGAEVIAGGLGVGKSIWGGGNLNLRTTGASQSYTRYDTGTAAWVGGEDLGGSVWHNRDPSGIGAHDIAAIKVIQNGGSTTPTADMVFYASDTNAVMTERFRIDGRTGKVIFINDLVVTSGNETFLNLPSSAGTTGSLWSNAGNVEVAP